MQEQTIIPTKAESERFDLLIEAGRGAKNYWRDLWRYRELFYFLAWRDILVRYKQTAIGVAWALVRPFLTMLVFTFIFSRVAKLPAPGSVPYALLVFAAMLPWQFFSTALSEASNSLIGNSNLISKVYFPRLIVPAGSVITSFVDFLITLGLMAGMMVWYGFLPDWRLLTLPLFMALAFGSAFGAGLWLCALNVRYRDFRYIVPFIVQFGLYLSPVGFSSNIVPEGMRLIYALNPMVGVIDGFRWALLRGQSPLAGYAIIASILVTSVLCLSGIWYFRRTEKTFADII
ncbi:MAG TPA: ABC transporter permease [Blastocatellia bacterium]|jgi:lipopolysaccharide transport system permease protein|nr:ABC transporter permease [Blastocatellia bacterium]